MTTTAVEMQTMWTVMESPIGDLRLVARDGSITAIEFSPFQPSDVGAPIGERERRPSRSCATRSSSSRRTSPAT